MVPCLVVHEEQLPFFILVIGEKKKSKVYYVTKNQSSGAFVLKCDKSFKHKMGSITLDESVKFG